MKMSRAVRAPRRDGERRVERDRRLAEPQPPGDAPLRPVPRTCGSGSCACRRRRCRSGPPWTRPPRAPAAGPWSAGPPTDVQGFQPRSNVRCQSALSRPRTRTSRRRGPHDATARPRVEQAAQRFPAVPASVEPAVPECVVGAADEDVDAARSPRHGRRGRRQPAAQRLPVVPGVGLISQNDLGARARRRCRGRRRRAGPASHDHIRRRRGQRAAERIPAGHPLTAPAGSSGWPRAAWADRTSRPLASSGVAGWSRIQTCTSASHSGSCRARHACNLGGRSVRSASLEYRDVLSQRRQRPRLPRRDRPAGGARADHERGRRARAERGLQPGAPPRRRHRSGHTERGSRRPAAEEELAAEGQAALEGRRAGARRRARARGRLPRPLPEGRQARRSPMAARATGPRRTGTSTPAPR